MFIQIILEQYGENADNPCIRDTLNVARAANRARQKLRPKHPLTMDFTIDMAFVKDGFLQADLNVQGHRHLVFVTAYQLQLVANSKTWFVFTS